MFGLNIQENIHRSRYIHICPNCQKEIKTYRPCSNEHCGLCKQGKLKHHDIIAPTPYEYVPSKITRNIGGTTYFDTSIGDYINTKDIDRICQEKGYLYGNDNDIEREGQRNYYAKTSQAKRDFKEGLIEQLNRTL